MKILAAFALSQEAFPLAIDGTEMVEFITGIGKTQAAGSLALAIAEHKPDRVLNIGTVGTYRHNVGDILVSRHFIDRDMHRLPIDTVCREIDLNGLSFAYDLKSVIGGVAVDKECVINTGDNFVMNAEEDLGCDAVDMEAFAMAWVCQKCDIPFLSVKYVTDILGQNSVELWADKLEYARKDLQAYFAPLTGNLFR